MRGLSRLRETIDVDDFGKTVPTLPSGQLASIYFSELRCRNEDKFAFLL